MVEMLVCQGMEKAEGGFRPLNGHSKAEFRSMVTSDEEGDDEKGVMKVKLCIRKVPASESPKPKAEGSTSCATISCSESTHCVTQQDCDKYSLFYVLRSVEVLYECIARTASVVVRSSSESFESASMASINYSLLTNSSLLSSTRLSLSRSSL